MRKIIIPLVLFLFFSHCSNNADIKALAIYQRAQALEKQGKELEALAVYDKLIKYKGTLPYERAQKKLEAKGYSLGVSLTSWSVHRMMEVENLIVRYVEANKTFPPDNAFQDMTDAWGRSFQITYKPTPNIVFLIYSPGGDGKEDSEDDLRIAYTKKFKFELNQEKQDAHRISLDAIRRSASDSSQSEKAIPLDALSAPEKKQTPSEKSMDLNELLNQKKDTNKVGDK